MNDRPSDEPGPPPAKPEAIFVLELGLNGGSLAPSSVEELRNWLAHEDRSWHWFPRTPGGSHRHQIDQGIASLRSAVEAANQIAAHPEGSDSQRRAIQNCQSHVRDTFVERKLPHSDSESGRRIKQVLDSIGANAAAAYAGVVTAGPQARFEPNDLESLHGLSLALRTRFGGDDGGVSAARLGFEELRGQLAATRDNEVALFEKLQREHERLRSEISSLRDAATDDFDSDRSARENEWALLKTEHERALEKMRDAFRTGMQLRAPVTYWQAKARRHTTAATCLAIATLAAMACVTVLLVLGLPWLAPPIGVDGKPDPWRLGVLVLAGIFVVWAIRLLVKIFLSELHLAHDASERVTMATTYLSLQESGGLADHKSLDVVLGALFRPAADGVVKDEGLPPGVAELLTRSK